MTVFSQQYPTLGVKLTCRFSIKLYASVTKFMLILLQKLLKLKELNQKRPPGPGLGRVWLTGVAYTWPTCVADPMPVRGLAGPGILVLA